MTSPKYAGLLEYGGGYAGAYLLRRGFNYEAVREAVAAAWQATRAEQADDEIAGNYSFDTLEE